MIHRNDLFQDLSEEVVKKTLEACFLEEKDEYLEEEGERFLHCRDLIDNGKSYQEVAAMLNASPQETSQTNDVEKAKSQIKQLLSQLAPEDVRGVIDEIAQERAEFRQFVRQGARMALAQELIAQAESGELEKQLNQVVQEGNGLRANGWIELEGTQSLPTKQLPGS